MEYADILTEGGAGVGPVCLARENEESAEAISCHSRSRTDKSAVLGGLTSRSGQRTYDHAINEFVDWYCSEPRLAFNRTVVLRYRIHLE